MTQETKKQLPPHPQKNAFIEFESNGIYFSGYIKYIFTKHIVIDSTDEPAHLMCRETYYNELRYEEK